MVKNLTLLASLLGTWTAQWTIKDNNISISFVAHFLPDPMRGYGCEERCHEWNNQFCFQEKCTSNGRIPWSDVAVFYYFETSILIDEGNSANETQQWNWTSGDWMGPYSVVFAQSNSSSSSTTTLDRYSTRYVKTPATIFLKAPGNASFAHQFETYMGKRSVDETFAVQTNHSKDSQDDPAFNNSCKSGSVRPVLPLMDFSFIKSPKDGDDDGTEYVIAQLDYKIFVMPLANDPMYNLLPKYQRIENYTHLIKGPYCYRGDPNGAFALDISTASSGGKASANSIKLIHGCVPGLACFPPAAAMANGTILPTSNPHSPHGRYDSNSFHSSTMMTSVCYILIIAFMISIAFNRQQQKRHDVLLRRLRELHEEEVARIGGRYLQQQQEEEDEDDPDMAYIALEQQQQQQEPLLPTCEEGEEDDADKEKLLRFT